MNASTASAYVGPNLLRNWETGRCLDSNISGQVYTLPCQQGNDYQTWNIIFNRHTSHDVVQVQNKATGRCLYYTTGSGVITTRQCDVTQNGLWTAIGSGWDKVQLQSFWTTSQCLNGNEIGGVYPENCYNDGNQLWKLGY